MLRLNREFAETYRREWANIGWLLADRAVRVLGTFLIGVAAARLLGPAAYGEISYAQTIFAFLLLGAALGLNAVVVKRLVDLPDEAFVTLGTAFALQSAVMVTALVATCLLTAQGSTSALIMILATGLVLRPTEVFRYWFEANVNARRAVIADNIGFIVSGAVKIAVLVEFRTVEALAWALAFEQILGGLCLIVAYGTDRSRPRGWRVDRDVLWQLSAQSWPLLLAGLSVALYMRIDQFVIMSIRGPAETGLYVAAVRLSEIIYVLPAVVATSFFPRWQALMGQSEAAHARGLGSAMTAMVAVCLVIALCFSLAAVPLIRSLYGDGYAAAAPVLAIHAWTCVFVAMGVLGNQWYLSHGLQSRTLLCTLLGVAFSFALNVLLVPGMGAVGSAIASLVAQIVSAFLADALSGKTRPLFALKVWALFWPVLIAKHRLSRTSGATTSDLTPIDQGHRKSK